MNEIEKICKNVSQRINKNVQCEDCPFECDGSLPCYLVTMCNALQEKAERDKMRCENCKHFVDCEGGLCERTNLFEFPSFNKTDFCSYFKEEESEEQKWN